MAVRLIEVPGEVARTAALALERRGERGGGTRAGVMLATALTTGFVKPAELGELRGWHHANPDEVIGGQCTTLAGLHGGAPAREWLADLAPSTAALGAPCYLDDLANRILAAGPDAEGDPALYRIYAVLANAKGTATTARDVHDAWVAWKLDSDPAHDAIAPFDDLTPEVQALDDPYVAAIHAAVGTPPGTPPDAPAVAAVGNPLATKLAKVSATINRADRTTMVRLHAAATVALNEALRQASNKITGKANDRRKSAAARAAVQAANGVYPPAVLAAVGVTEQELLDRRFDTFEAMAVAMLMAAERKKLAAAARALGLAPDEVEHEYAEQIDTRAAAAGAMMVTALGLLARSALSGHAVTPESVQGEFSGPVPFGIVRDAVTVASRGGSVPTVDETGPGPSAIDALAGKLSDVGESLVEDLLSTMDVRVQQRSTWSHGDPDRPFEPHANLDGVSWVDTQPEALDWDAGEFPYVDVLQPGDHEGCTCLIETDYEPYDGGDGAPVGDGIGVGAPGDTEGALVG